MEILNNYSGLISLVAAVAAIGAIIVPFVIFKKQRKYEAEKEELAKKEMAEMERKDAQAELDAMGVTDAPISLYGGFLSLTQSVSLFNLHTNIL